jgi:uncharacterized protein YciI
MLYAILGEDVPDGQAKRAAARPAHLAHIDELIEAGRIVLAGPFPGIDSPDPGPAGMVGSLIVAEFESLAAAQAWIDADAYVTGGVFGKVTVRPFRQVYPGP